MRPFYFVHKTTGHHACGHFGDRNVDTHGSSHLVGSEVRKTMVWVNHVITELGFQMVMIGLHNSSKEVVRTGMGEGS